MYRSSSCKLNPCSDVIQTPISIRDYPGFPAAYNLHPHTISSEMAQLHNQKKCSIKKELPEVHQLKPLIIRLLAHSNHDGNDLRRDRNRGLHIRSCNPVIPVSMSMWRQICCIDRRLERRRRHRSVSLMFVDGEGDF